MQYDIDALHRMDAGVNVGHIEHERLGARQQFVHPAGFVCQTKAVAICHFRDECAPDPSGCARNQHPFLAHSDLSF